MDPFHLLGGHQDVQIEPLQHRDLLPQARDRPAVDRVEEGFPDEFVLDGQQVHRAGAEMRVQRILEHLVDREQVMGLEDSGQFPQGVAIGQPAPFRVIDEDQFRAVFFRHLLEPQGQGRGHRGEVAEHGLDHGLQGGPDRVHDAGLVQFHGGVELPGEMGDAVGGPGRVGQVVRGGEDQLVAEPGHHLQDHGAAHVGAGLGGVGGERREHQGPGSTVSCKRRIQGMDLQVTQVLSRWECRGGIRTVGITCPMLVG